MKFSDNVSLTYCASAISFGTTTMCIKKNFASTTICRESLESKKVRNVLATVYYPSA